MNPESQNPPEAEAGADPVAELQAQLDAAQTDLAAAREREAAAIAGHRDALRAAHPTIPPQLIDGSNAEELAASLTRATELTAEAVRLAGVAATNGHSPATSVPVPAGGGTAPVDRSAMSARERIAHGLANRTS